MSCSTGASVAPGISPTAEIMMTVETWKQMTGQESTWFDTWLGFLEPQVVKVSDLCAANPSDPGNPTVALLSDVFSNPSFGIPEVLNYAINKMQYFEFSKVCVCNPGSPANCVDQNPFTTATNLVSSGNHCFSVEFTANTTGPLGQVGIDVGAGFPANMVIYLWDGATTSLIHTETIAHTFTTGHNLLTLATPQTLTVGHNYWLGYDYTGGPFNQVTASTVTADTRFTPVNAGYSVGFGTFPATIDGFWRGIYPVLCSLAPTPVSQPSQPSDVLLPVPPTCSTTTDLCSLLTQIQQQIHILNNTTNLYGRRIQPFAWIAGTPVAGLTGHGTLTVQDIIGVTVSLTTIPASWGFTADTPKRYIPTLGSIQASDGTVFDDWRQIHYANEIFDIPSWATEVNYSLRPNIVATITPLQPEP